MPGTWRHWARHLRKIAKTEFFNFDVVIVYAFKSLLRRPGPYDSPLGWSCKVQDTAGERFGFVYCLQRTSTVGSHNGQRPLARYEFSPHGIVWEMMFGRSQTMGDYAFGCFKETVTDPLQCDRHSQTSLQHDTILQSTP